MEKRHKVLNWIMRAVAAVAVAATLAAPALAQTDVTTGRISGVVVDADGGVLPGVAIEVRNNETGFTRRAVTDARGWYVVLNLPTGTYTVTASLAGFATATRSDVRLVLGSAPTVDFTMQLAAGQESITVTAEIPLVEVTRTSVGTTILTEQLASLPVNNRDFETLVYLTPESRKESERGYISLSGQRGINTNVTIDGVDNMNGFFGGVTGDAEGRAPLSLSIESIKEFSVITNGASAEFGRSAGGFVNVITKSGTNEFHGSAFWYNQPQSLVADPPAPLKLNDQSKDQYGFSLGGRFIPDKLFFFTSYDQQAQDETVNIDAKLIDADIFAKYPALATPPTYVRTNDGRVLFGRLDYFLSNTNRVMARANYADYEGINGTWGSPTRAESYNGIEMLYTRSYVASHSATIGSNMLNDLNLQYVIEDTPRKDKGLNLPDIQVRNWGNYGEVAFLPIDSTNHRKTLADTFTWMLGEHVAKGGIEYNESDVDQVFKGNWRGVYLFNSKADLLAGKWYEYRQFIPLGGKTVDEAGNSNFAQKELAFFAQDQWYLRPDLTVTFGLRWERLDNPDFGILNPDDMNANGSFNKTRHIPDMDNQWSPRVGVTWAPAANTAVRFSAGRFWSRTPGLLWAQANTSNGYNATQLVLTAGSNGPTSPIAPPWGSTWTPEGGFAYINPAVVTSIPKPGVFTVDPNFENPYTDRYTLQFERELFANTALTLGAVYAKSEQLERLTDFNLQYDCVEGPPSKTCVPKTAPNGLPLYSTTRPYAYYSRITMYTSDARSEYKALTAVLQRRFVERFSGLLSVTWSKDQDNDSNERNYSGLQAEDKNDIERNWGYSNRDQRWKIAANGTWNTPWWGFVVSGSAYYNTGQPYNITAGSDLNKDGDSGTDRPTVGGVHFARNSGRQPDYWGLNLRLQKPFRLGPGQLSAVVECFNCTDEQDYRVTSTVWGTGETPRSDFGKKSYVGTPRTFQLALRYDF